MKKNKKSSTTYGLLTAIILIIAGFFTSNEYFDFVGNDSSDASITYYDETDEEKLSGEDSTEELAQEENSEGLNSEQLLEQETSIEEVGSETTLTYENSEDETESKQNILEDENASENVESVSEFSKSTVDSNPETIPKYSGADYYIMNDDHPNFNEYDIENITGEHFSELDELSRCGCAYAMLHKSMEPTGKRDSISEIKPSGWKQRQYEGLIDTDPPFLYNRSHLIAYAMTGQNANEKNLITGTRYFNATTMLWYEEKVMRYLDSTGNHVLYRVTPLFIDDELVARGVEMEAFSIEDGGEGICFHVFVYNYQPGVKIDYKTGKNWLRE